LQEKLAVAPGPPDLSLRWKPDGVGAIRGFLAGLKWNDWNRLAVFFSDEVEIVDAGGKRWKGIAAIEKNSAVLFAPYATKRAAYRLESTGPGPGGSLLASALWQGVSDASQTAKSVHRMSILVAPELERWAIFLIHVTPVNFHAP
jgi:ketosteroid isomerase-like protein